MFFLLKPSLINLIIETLTPRVVNKKNMRKSTFFVSIMINFLSTENTVAKEYPVSADDSQQNMSSKFYLLGFLRFYISRPR